MKKVCIYGEPNTRRDRLEQRIRAAATELNMEIQIQCFGKAEILRDLGIRVTPALWIDGLPKISGFVPEIPELQDYLCGLDAMPKSFGQACGFNGCA